MENQDLNISAEETITSSVATSLSDQVQLVETATKIITTANALCGALCFGGCLLGCASACSLDTVLPVADVVGATVVNVSVTTGSTVSCASA